MIPAVRLVFEFDRRYDRFQGQQKHALKLVQKVSLLNEALEIYFEDRVKKAETSSKLRNDLRKLEVKEFELKEVERLGTHSIYEIPENSYKLLRVEVRAKKGKCTTAMPAIMMQTDDLTIAKKNEFWKSSFEWEHVLADEGDKGLYLYHDGAFSVTSVFADYYRRPKEIQAPSLAENGWYIDWNGKKQVKDQGLELDTTYSYKDIVDLAVLIARANVGDSRDFSLEAQKILQVSNSLMK